jgi:membrane associated rhomboid family serine protease
MVFPIADDNSDRTTTPVVNYALIAVNIFVFVVLQGFGANEPFTYAFATVPEKIWTGKNEQTEPRAVRDPLTGARVTLPGQQKTPGSVYLTLLTSMFLHGGIAHIFGNMLFLWIFGDNVEDRLGHGRYLIFYLLCGVLASLAHVMATYAFDGNPQVPSLGASGAISGVLGGYIMLYPLRRVTVILFRFLTDVPAYVAIGIWFLFQLVSGFGAFGDGAQMGGVAYGAHIGGFLSGVLLIRVFLVGRAGPQWLPPPDDRWRPPPEEGTWGRG